MAISADFLVAMDNRSPSEFEAASVAKKLCA